MTKEQKPKACCIIVKRKRCFKHEGGCTEPDYALGWILDDGLYDNEVAQTMLKTMEEYGLYGALAKKV